MQETPLIMRRRAMLVFGAVLALGLAGCGSGDGTATPVAEDAADQASADTDDTAADSDTADEADESLASEDPADETVDAASFTGPSEPVKITYRMTGDAEIDELTMAWDPPRFAMIFEEGRMIVTGGETVFCDASGDGCFQMGFGAEGGMGAMAGGAGAFFGFAEGIQQGEDLPGATVTGEAEIAGRSATCATYDAAQYDPSLQGEAEFCYDVDAGVVLRWSATDADGATQTLEAVEVGEPDPSDFEPTGPVQQMPGMGDQEG